MRSRILCVLLGLAMGWTAGCATARVSSPPKEKQSKRPPRTIDTPGRQIGLLKWGSTCPTVPDWSTQTLRELSVAHAEDGMKRSYYGYGTPPKPALADSKLQVKAEALFRKHGLDRICVYTVEKKSEKAFPKLFRFSKVGPDKLALTPNAPTDLDPLGDQIWEPLAQRFLDQIGKAQLDSAQNPVRLVFVDTHPTDEELPAKLPAPISWHGYGMAHLGYELVCGHGTSQSCPIHVATRLALRYEGYHSESPDDPGNDNGGRQGRIGDLAIAILAEIEHWKTIQPRPKLILNLSIGWDSEYNEPDATRRQELDAATQAVYDALDYARDLGVLVIAAAGNRSGGQNYQGPLLPAAWELRPPTGASGSIDRKVVYAVGGVDWQGLPLPNARPGGMPVRVAYADHAVAKTSNGNGGVESTKIYTGSSVAAVVASSTAAVVWHLRPDLTLDQVMERMDDAANPLPSTATFYSSNNGPPPLKRLSLCKTVLSLCEDGGPCLAAGSVYCPQEYTSAHLSGITPQVSSPLDVSSITITPSNCAPQAQVYMKSDHPVSNTSSCPMETLPDVNDPSMTQTQPPDTPCSTCTVVPDRPAVIGMLASLAPSLDELPSVDPDAPKPYGLAAAIDPDWLAQATPDTISSAILVIECTTGSPITERLDVTQQFSDLLRSSLTTAPLNPIRISFGPIGGRATLDHCTASVDFKLKALVGGTETERSVQSPVYVDP